jgi:hypothetical protein
MKIHIISFSLVAILFMHVAVARQTPPLEITLPFTDKPIFSGYVFNLYDGLSFHYDITKSKKIVCHFSNFRYKGWLEDEAGHTLVQVNEDKEVTLTAKPMLVDSDSNLIHVHVNTIGKITVMQIEKPVTTLRDAPASMPTVSCAYENDL